MNLNFFLLFDEIIDGPHTRKILFDVFTVQLHHPLTRFDKALVHPIKGRTRLDLLDVELLAFSLQYETNVFIGVGLGHSGMLEIVGPKFWHRPIQCRMIFGLVLH